MAPSMVPAAGTWHLVWYLVLTFFMRSYDMIFITYYVYVLGIVLGMFKNNHDRPYFNFDYFYHD